MKYEAYWISPRGLIVPVEGTATTHIAMIWKNPGFFGLGRDELLAVHRKHGERPGLEGKARQEIMAGLLRQGWIRIRFVPKTQAFTVQTGLLVDPGSGYLWEWANKVTNGEIDSLNAHAYHLRIFTGRPQESFDGSMQCFIDKERPGNYRRYRTVLVHLKRSVS